MTNTDSPLGWGNLHHHAAEQTDRQHNYSIAQVAIMVTNTPVGAREQKPGIKDEGVSNGNG